ncbi:MAG: DNA mismatch repair endonuclease MutL [Clostridiales bacterium]|nr:DNA mismatch repair endonuclease MutL [Clostridiales bacterium]
MSSIQILDETTINQIAAGEVVERPRAVVKELVENAMDAGSTAITVEIKEGGISLIRVTDNGAGIEKEDISNAFLRHATSKIRTATDLLSVTSLGFRGEALSSIAAVAQVELITKTQQSLNGYRYIIEGGEEKSMEEIGCPDGTTILVRNLFFNTPARRKFLKSSTTEAGYISDLMERLMISHPNVSFKYIVNNKVKLQSSGNNSIKDILYHVYGRDITKELVSIDSQSQDVKITGYVAKPTISRGNRNFENYFINGRYIKSPVITRAIEDAYKSFLMQHKYPFTSLYFDIEPSLIDVNVHPQKMEIRFKNSNDIYQLTYQTIRDALTGKELIPKVSLSEEKKSVNNQMPRENILPEPFEKNRRIQMEELKQKTQNMPLFKVKSEYLNSSKTVEASKDEINVNNLIRESTSVPKDFDASTIDKQSIEMQPYKDRDKQNDTDANINTSISDQVSIEQVTQATTVKDDTDHKGDVPLEQLNLFKDSNIEEVAPFLSKEAFGEHRIIGQVFATFWLVEYNNELFIIDQHAAHEKVMYERIMATTKEKAYASQMLMPPIVLSLTSLEQDILKKHEEELHQIGYELEPFGGNEISVRAVPANLYGLSEKKILLEFIDELTDNLGSNTLSTRSVLEKIASLSCKAAVKANHAFSSEEASALIKELLTLEDPYHCPHGRPVIISMSRYELEKKFKRII